MEKTDQIQFQNSKAWYSVPKKVNIQKNLKDVQNHLLQWPLAKSWVIS